MEDAASNRRKGDELAARFLSFGVRVIHLIETLPKSVVGKHIALQMVRAATSAGANYEEARGAESRADFAQKVGVAWKEIREATYWLKLVREAAMVKPNRLADLVHEGEQLTAILGASCKTARNTPAS